MSLKIYNTLTRKKEEFIPINKEEVKMALEKEGEEWKEYNSAVKWMVITAIISVVLTVFFAIFPGKLMAECDKNRYKQQISKIFCRKPLSKGQNRYIV